MYSFALFYTLEELTHITHLVVQLQTKCYSARNNLTLIIQIKPEAVGQVA